MYAVIRTGGKQYTVRPGDVVRVEKLNQELGAEWECTEVLYIGGDNQVVGKPLVPQAKVTLVVTHQDKDKKILIFKKKRRQGYRRMKGHRQSFTELFVKAISVGTQSVQADSEARVRRPAEVAEEATEASASAAAGKKVSAKASAKKSGVKKTAGSKVAKAKKAAPKKKAAATKSSAQKASKRS